LTASVLENPQLADKFVKRKSMKGKYTFVIIVFLLVSAIYSGCQSKPDYQPSYIPEPESEPVWIWEPVQIEESPPVIFQPDTMMPLTPSIIYRLADSYNYNRLPDNVGKYQFALRGTITLENEYTRLNDRVLDSGRVKFEDVHIRENITIDDQTEGQGTSIDIFGSEIVISVCFESDDLYRLNFSAPAGDPDGYFYLKYSPVRNIPYGDEKGTIEYGGDPYRIKFAGEKSPHLLITLSRQDVFMLNSRTVPGRKVS
jgi:hypothetical protein